MRRASHPGGCSALSHTAWLPVPVPVGLPAAPPGVFLPARYASVAVLLRRVVHRVVLTRDQAVVIDSTPGRADAMISVDAFCSTFCFWALLSRAVVYLPKLDLCLSAPRWNETCRLAIGYTWSLRTHKRSQADKRHSVTLHSALDVSTVRHAHGIRTC